MRKILLLLGALALLTSGAFALASSEHTTRLLGLTVILGGGLSLGYFVLSALVSLGRAPGPILRGRRVLSESESLRIHEAELHGEAPRYRFGGMPFRAETATRHFLLVGASGAGKTVTMKRLLADALRALPPGEKAFILDAKTDVLSYLDHLGFPAPRISEETESRVALLHPFDERSLAWDIARDIEDLSTLREIAHILIPHEDERQKHFPLTAANILAHTALTLHRRAPGRWTLRDLYLATRSRTRLEAVLALTPEGRDVISLHFSGSEEFQSVLSTLSTHMSRYAPVAASWWRAYEGGRRFSLSEWARGTGQPVLVLGVDDSRAEALEPIGRVIFHRLSQLLLRPGQKRASGPRTWVFLDELPHAGHLRGLRKLMDKGRSYGVSVAIGFQSIESMATAFRSQEEALAITANCASKALFRAESERTARFAAELLGPVEVLERSESESASWSEHGTSRTRSVSYQPREKAAVLSSEIFTLGPTSLEHGLRGIYLSEYAAWRAEERTFPRRDPSRRSPDFLPLGPLPELSSWTAEDLERLGLEELMDKGGVLDADDDTGWVHGPSIP